MQNILKDRIAVDSTVIAAIVGAGASLAVVILSYIFTPIWERNFHVFKLEQEYRYEQRKKIKGILAENKIHLINSCEELIYRLWNLSSNYDEDWQDSRNSYYFISFIYRFLAVFAWVKKTKEEMLYLDSTIATKKDMEFIKFLRLINQMLCDVQLFDNCNYDKNAQKDHFFSNNLGLYSQSIIKEKRVLTYTEFRENYDEIKPKIEGVCRFIEGVSPNEDRLRWDRLQLLNITLMVFLNSFGYEFQYTTDEKFKEIMNRPRPVKLGANYIILVQKNKLSTQKNFKRVLKLIATSEFQHPI